MNAVRIDHILKLDKFTASMFYGFSTPDLPIPKFKKLPALIILNTGLSNTDGEHWCVACFPKSKMCYFYDPYGRSPAFYGLDIPLLQACKRYIRYNEKEVQGMLSKTCGHHCLFFALKYGRGIKPNQIMRMYHPVNNRRNDNMVYDYVRRMSSHIIAAIRD